MNLRKKLAEYKQSIPKVKDRDSILKELHGRIVKYHDEARIRYSSEFFKALRILGLRESEAREPFIRNFLPDSRVKISKILAREGIDYSRIVQPALEINFQFSVRFKDIINCASSKHYSSCFAPDGVYRSVPVFFLKYRGAAILINRDKHGQFQHRAFVFLGWYENKPCLILDRPYGTGIDYFLLARAINNQLFPCIAQFQEGIKSKTFILKYRYPKGYYSNLKVQKERFIDLDRPPEWLINTDIVE